MSRLSNKPFPENGTIREEYDMCEHVESDQRKAHWMFCEDDTFGPLIRKVVCKACKEETFTAINEALEICDYCHEEVPANQMEVHRPFPFDVGAGDEPINVCPNCVNNPEHLEWLAENKRLRREAEEEYWEENEQEDDEQEYDEYP